MCYPPDLSSASTTTLMIVLRETRNSCSVNSALHQNRLKFVFRKRKSIRRKSRYFRLYKPLTEEMMFDRSNDGLWKCFRNPVKEIPVTAPATDLILAKTPSTLAKWILWKNYCEHCIRLNKSVLSATNSRIFERANGFVKRIWTNNTAGVSSFEGYRLADILRNSLWSSKAVESNNVPTSRRIISRKVRKSQSVSICCFRNENQDNIDLPLDRINTKPITDTTVKINSSAIESKYNMTQLQPYSSETFENLSNNFNTLYQRSISELSASIEQNQHCARNDHNLLSQRIQLYQQCILDKLEDGKRILQNLVIKLHFLLVFFSLKSMNGVFIRIFYHIFRYCLVRSTIAQRLINLAQIGTYNDHKLFTRKRKRKRKRYLHLPLAIKTYKSFFCRRRLMSIQYIIVLSLWILPLFSVTASALQSEELTNNLTDFTTTMAPKELPYLKNSVSVPVKLSRTERGKSNIAFNNLLN